MFDTYVGSGVENVSILKLYYLILFVTFEHKKKGCNLGCKARSSFVVLANFETLPPVAGHETNFH